MARPTSAATRIEKINWRGFEAYLLENAVIRCTVVPALGGKIASLIHLPSMREWLWRNAELEPRQPTYGASYVMAHDCGGFDECFPSVAATFYPAGPWEGTRVPDHGEIWALPWKAEPFCDGNQVELRLTTHGIRFPYRFERTLLMTADEPVVRLSYNVINPTPFPFPFLWSAHPLFTVTPGMRLVAPLHEMTVYASVQDRYGRLGTPVEWPHVRDVAGQTWDLDAFPDYGTGVALKLFGRSPSQGYVSLQDSFNGAELRLHFDPAEVTHLGLWLNFNGWCGMPGGQPYYNVAIEPGIGASDDLDLAVRHYHEYGVLPASGRRAWALELRLK